MASSREYVAYILEQLEPLPVSARAMMGEYVVYYRDKVIGGIYDNQFLIKVTPAGAALMPDCPQFAPYPGAKPMFAVENVEDKEMMRTLLSQMYEALPARKKH